jgi:transposase
VGRQIVAAVLTAITNATSESLNRLAKLETRHAYGRHGYRYCFRVYLPP